MALSICTSLSALPQCWLAQATCTAFCAQRDGNATLGCGVTNHLCAPSDAAVVTPQSSSNNSALTVVAAAGSAFTCLQPPVVYPDDSSLDTILPATLGFFGGVMALVFVLPRGLLYCNTLWPAQVPRLSDLRALGGELREVRESVRAVSRSASLRSGSARFEPPAQLTWEDSARLDKTRLRKEEEDARGRLAEGKARLVDLALLGEWPALEERFYTDKSDMDAGPDEFGWRPLHHAARLGAPLTTISLLLEAYPGTAVAHTLAPLDGFAPIVRATDMQLLLLLSLTAAAVCVVPVAIALSVTRPIPPVGTLGVCFGTSSVAFTFAFVILLAYFPAPFYFKPVDGDSCILLHIEDEEARASRAGAAAARLHRAMAVLNKRMPDRLKGRAWVRPAAVRTPLGVAADALQRALLARSPDAASFAEAVRALAWAAPHTLLRTSMVNTRFGRALLRDVLLSDSALLWRPYSDAAGSNYTLTQLAVAARDEAIRDGGREPESGAPNARTLFTLLDAHMLFGVPPPPELLQALPTRQSQAPGKCCLPTQDAEWFTYHIEAAERERETVQNRAYAMACTPVVYTAAGCSKPVLLGEGGFATVKLYRRQTITDDDSDSTPASTEPLMWEQPYSPGVAVKVYTPAATKELDAHALERTKATGGGVAGAPKAGARIAALLNETFRLQMMDHPHVVRFLDATAVGDRLELFMQLAPGGDLHSAFAKATQHVRWRAQGARLAREAAAGLRYLHGKGVAHRDLKPNNVLLSGPLPAGAVLLADFGISADAQHRAPDTSRTEKWAAPEAANPELEGKDLYPADVFSLGLIMCQLITCTEAPCDGMKVSIRKLDDLECPWCDLKPLGLKGKRKTQRLQWAAHGAHAPVDESGGIGSDQLAALLEDAGAIAVDMCCSECGTPACSLAAAALACAAAQHEPTSRPTLDKLCAFLEVCEPLAGQETAKEAAGDAGGDRLAPQLSCNSTAELLVPLLEHVSVEC